MLYVEKTVTVASLSLSMSIFDYISMSIVYLSLNSGLMLYVEKTVTEMGRQTVKNSEILTVCGSKEEMGRPSLRASLILVTRCLSLYVCLCLE